jgi:hypothetical protein
MIRGSGFRSLNDVSGSAINRQWSVAVSLMPWIYFRFQRHSGHSRLLLA